MTWQIRPDAPGERVPAEVVLDDVVTGAPDEGAAEPRPLLSRGDQVLVASVFAIVVALFPIVLLPLAALGVVAVRVLSRRGGFGFADGFLRFDDRVRWPRGVQEEDEVRWHWTT